MEFKWQQASGTLLSILADLSNAIVWMVSTNLLIYKSSNPWTNPLVTVSIIIIIILLRVFHSPVSRWFLSGVWLIIIIIILRVFHSPVSRWFLSGVWLIIIIIILLRVFHSPVSRWFLSGVWLIIIIIILLRVFHSPVSRWFLSGVWLIIIIIIIILRFFFFFFTPAFDNRLLLDSERQQVTLSLVDFNNGIAGMFLAHPPMSNASRPLRIVPSAPIRRGIWTVLVFHDVFSSLESYKYLPLFSFSLIFSLWSVGTAMSTIRDLFVSQNLREFCASHSSGRTLLCAYTIWLDFNFLHSYQWISFPTQSCLVLYSFCTNYCYIR